MAAFIHSIQQGICWVLSVPPEAYNQVANVVKAIICGAPPTP